MPYRGRVILRGFVTYSTKTIAKNADSHNLLHFLAFEGLKDNLGERPLVPGQTHLNTPSVRIPPGP